VTDEVLELLLHGTVEIESRFANSSNTTLLARVELDGRSVHAVYKPEAGERPLWDFPPGLWRREVAAYLVAEHMGIGLVPETVARRDAPAGPGSLQRFVDEDLSSHYFTLREEPRYHDVLRSLAAFDVVANNSDRKSGHVLRCGEELWAIDHGLCFHEQDKLRTVIWDFSGELLAPSVQAGLARLAAGAPAGLETLLTDEEIVTTTLRAAELLAQGVLPEPDEDRPYPPYPWPLV
jgi:uncharacterized repeat protein (TIGR03843 family)